MPNRDEHVLGVFVVIHDLHTECSTKCESETSLRHMKQATNLIGAGSNNGVEKTGKISSVVRGEGSEEGLTFVG